MLENHRRANWYSAARVVAERLGGEVGLGCSARLQIQLRAAREALVDRAPKRPVAERRVDANQPRDLVRQPVELWPYAIDVPEIEVGALGEIAIPAQVANVR